MEAGMQRGERSLKGDDWPDAETLYNEIIKGNTSPEEDVPQSTESSGDLNSHKAETNENASDDPMLEEVLTDSGEDPELIQPQVVGMAASSLDETLPEVVLSVSLLDPHPISPEGTELNEITQEDLQIEPTLSDSREDTRPIPAEVVELDEYMQEYPMTDELFPDSNEDTNPVPAEVVELDEYIQEAASLEEVIPAASDFVEPAPAQEVEPGESEQEGQASEDVLPILSESLEPVMIVQEVAPAESPKKIALILSGGGARGAFQVGAEIYARQVKGYHWDIIAGVSVGAMNGAMLSMHRYVRLLEIWDTISDDQVYTGGFNLPSVIKLLFGAKAFYGNEPLQKMMQRELAAGKIIDDLHVGAVSLISGEYVQFTKEFLELPDAILASASIPVIWPPVDISLEHLSMVDGGVRNNSPVGDVLALEPDEIVIINCSPQNPPPAPEAPDNVLSIGMRALDIMQNEIFVNDVKDFLRINALVKEAQENGVILHHPRTGKPFKYYPSVVIEPVGDLGETLDFSRQAVQASLRAGVRRAREVLGRP